MNLIEKAELYAKDKIVDSLNKTVTEAYIEGYKTGYKDCEDTLPLIYKDNKTEFVDLGLPSGTLWSKDYEKRDGEVLYLPYCEAKEFSLATEEQYKELIENCISKKIFFFRTSNIDKCIFIGPNGNEIEFKSKGYFSSTEMMETGCLYAWINNTEQDNKDNRYCCLKIGFNVLDCNMRMFSGYKIPIRLVKKTN